MIRSRVGKSLYGENLFFGYRTLADLVKDETLSGMVGIAIMGRRLTEPERRLLDAIAVISTSADAHIWPLKMLRLVSSYGSVLAGYCACQVAVEGERIGYWVAGGAAAVLVELKAAIGDRMDDPAAVEAAITEYLRRGGHVLGFGVPLRKSDERLDALNAYVAAERLGSGLHWRLQEAIGAYLLRARGVPPNIVIGIAAVLLDMGCTPRQVSALAHFMVQPVFAAHGFEAAQQRAPEMQKVADEHIAYIGPARRESPRSLARREEVK